MDACRPTFARLVAPPHTTSTGWREGRRREHVDGVNVGYDNDYRLIGVPMPVVRCRTQLGLPGGRPFPPRCGMRARGPSPGGELLDVVMVLVPWEGDAPTAVVLVVPSVGARLLWLRCARASRRHPRTHPTDGTALRRLDLRAGAWSVNVGAIRCRRRLWRRDGC
jgi:hypothetical protein